ncbi:hypothetical protein [Acuticoccus mangrovi]|uniref:Uncharacterized protein n=1 Tax=Acuticoccus mangrovi TaxID=2796142 RepID=A0A934MLY0_9HYPH|nr:hypothetical protein [Acuticoccus mangrovi]MBJ3776774.1 hypothetical protein [Acuticoccus mangrovi]
MPAASNSDANPRIAARAAAAVAHGAPAERGPAIADAVLPVVEALPRGEALPFGAEPADLVATLRAARR